MVLAGRGPHVCSHCLVPINLKFIKECRGKAFLSSQQRFFLQKQEFIPQTLSFVAVDRFIRLFEEQTKYLLPRNGEPNNRDILN